MFAFEHSLGRGNHELRMTDFENSAEGPRKIRRCVIVLRDDVMVGVARADSGSPRTDGVVYMPPDEDRYLSFETVEPQLVRQVFLANTYEFDRATSEAASTMSELFALFEKNDCATWRRTPR